MSIVSLDEVKAKLRISTFDDDAELNAYLNGVTATVEDYLHLVVEQRQMVERVRLDGRSRRFLLHHLPAVALVSMTDRDGNPVDVAGLDLDVDTGVVEVVDGTRLRGRYTVTYTAGFDPVPENYKRGALVILQHVWETQRGVGSVRPGIIGPEETYDPRYSYSIPRKALEWLGKPAPVIS